MSRLDSPQQQPADDARVVGAPGVGAVSITPTRHQMDDKFPELGFDIQIGDLPFYEVLLTTERSLFHPDRQQHRNRSNFNVSRWDTEPPRLTRAVGRPARYMVPPAVLQAFAKSKPKAIFYTLIAYASEEGRDPVFAHDPARLSAEAPSVTVAGEFTGQTLSTVLGIPAHMLMRVGEPRPAAGPNGRGAYAQGLGAASEQDDAGEGEDGYQASAHGLSDEWNNDDDGWGAEAYAAADEGDDEYPQDGYELQKAKSKSQSYGDDEDDDDESWGAAASASAYGEDDDEFYSDGFEHAGPIRPVEAFESRAQESVFPTEMGEPEDLLDSESAYDGEGLSSGESEYDYAASLSAEPDIDADSYALEEDDEDYASEPASAAAAHGRGGNGNGNGNGHAYSASAQHADQYSAGDDYSSGLAYDDGYGVQEGGSHRPHSHAAGYGDEAEMAFGALDDGSKLEASIDKKNMTEEDYRRIKEKVRIIEHITKDESGKALYKAVNRDGEFEGKFGDKHPAYRKFHIGLSYGIIQFTQDSGELGSLLKLMKQKDEKAFIDTFGPHQQELIDVTNAKGPASNESPGGRSARVQKVGGHDLWEDEWVRRFQQAGDHVPFQAAQIELAAKDFLDPMLPFAKSLGLDTDRALTMVVDRAVQMGTGRARRWIIAAINPIKTPAFMQQGLARLGHADLKSFQKAQGLKQDGDFGPRTHAALVGELRNLGPGASPVPLPTTKEMIGMLVRSAAAEDWGTRVRRIAEATSGFDDKPVQL